MASQHSPFTRLAPKIAVGAFVVFAYAVLAALLGPGPSDAQVLLAPTTQYLPLVLLPPAPTPTPTLPPNYYQGEFGYGINTAYSNYEGWVPELGFGYEKWYVRWADCEKSKGIYSWGTLRQEAAEALQHHVRIIMRVDYPPSWAAPGSGNRPPANASDFGSFVGALAAYMKGTVAAYELWNEPNLSCEWGNSSPDPARYTSLLKAAYPKIKAADPQVVVLSAGLATTGGDGGATALNDCTFIDAMYGAGAKGYFDALGSHPYGFANSPETRNANNVTDFRRAADQHAVMAAHGDGAKKVWATEFGWIIDPTVYGHPEYQNDWRWQGRWWQRVSPDTQADYLVRAYQYAYRNWPWMGVMCVFNLDFSAVTWYEPPEPMRFYSILHGYDQGSLWYTHRPAFDALKAMAKPTAR